ncbi:MAG: KEOPS complex subunit Pcc1 [Candidatus Bathyarchaeia archaeon]|nr:CTAG/PCC1 family protein [Candidatus Bathyarchaeota archaeon]
MIRGAYATLRIKYPSEREAEIIYKAIRPETRVVLRYRTKVNVSRSGEYITLTFEAKDTVALRASINSYLSWIISLKSIYDFLEKETH